MPIPRKAFSARLAALRSGHSKCASNPPFRTGRRYTITIMRGSSSGAVEQVKTAFDRNDFELAAVCLLPRLEPGPIQVGDVPFLVRPLHDDDRRQRVLREHVLALVVGGIVRYAGDAGIRDIADHA